MFKRKTKVSQNYSVLGSILRMFSYVKKHKLLLGVYLVISIIGIFINLSFANLINNSVGAAVDRNQNILKDSMVWTLIVVAVGLTVAFLSTYVYGRFKSGIMLDIRNNAMKHLQQLPVSFIENNHTGDVISRFTKDMNTVLNFIGDDLFKTAIQFVSLIITSIYLIHINWKLYALSVAIMPPVLYLSTLVTKPMGRFFKESSVHMGKANALAQDSYGGIFILKAFNLEKIFYNRFSETVNESLKYTIKGVHRLKWLPPFNILLWSSPFTICLIYGAFLSIKGEISPGNLPAFVYLLNNIVWPFSALPRIISNYKASVGTAQRFFEILDMPPERQGGSVFNTDGNEYIRFNNVSFSYKNTSHKSKPENSCTAATTADRLILNKLNLKLEKGRSIALVGTSGCGKSTTLKLISGFYDHYQGKIEIFGHDLQEWDLKAVRSKISFVSQEAYLFSASIFDNILAGKPDAPQEQVIAAARAANAHEFIMELPQGYDTPVGERAIKLSGGQKQRISLARAFLKDAPIILLDEPTSALDTISEAAIREAMNKVTAGKTVIIVTHRLSTIKDVDEIFVLDDGRVVESGTHEKLIATDSLYSRLYNSQIEKAV